MATRGATAVIWLTLVAGVTAAQGPGGPARLIDVPFLAQTAQLCGGAALAMVMRYWGDTAVLPADFTPLVDRSEGGIRTSALAKASNDRGWRTAASSARDATGWALIEASVSRGQPVIALIEERRGLFHYVVTTGITSDRIVVHDPAVGPFRALARADFDRRWQNAGRWFMVVLPDAAKASAKRDTVSPSAAEPSSNSPSSARPSTVGACSAQVARYVADARAGQLASAEAGLLKTTAACPSSSQAWGELAGVKFLQRRYAEAAALAQRADRLAPATQSTLELLGSSRFLSGDFIGALHAWNAIDEPRIDTISVQGLTRTRHPLVIEHSGLQSRTLLSADAFVRAERRLADLPMTSRAQVRFQPRSNGSAAVTLAMDERSRFPSGPGGWGVIGIGLIFRRELAVDVVSPTGQAEAMAVAYRWKERRPRMKVAFAAPAPGPVPGVVAVEGLWEEQTYQPLTDDDAGNLVRRKRVGVSLSDWARGWLRWEAGTSLDRFSDDARFVSAEGAMTLREPRDRFMASLAVGRWSALGQATGTFTTSRATAAWRSNIDGREPTWRANGGVVAVSTGAPLPVWPVASSSDTRGALLRAHGLFDDGFVRNEMLGRRVSFATVEYERPLVARGIARIGVAGFVDLAQAALRRTGDRSPVQSDIGVGLRVAGPPSLGQLRIDLAHGLRDGRTALSAGLVAAWGQ